MIVSNGIDGDDFAAFFDKDWLDLFGNQESQHFSTTQSKVKSSSDDGLPVNNMNLATEDKSPRSTLSKKLSTKSLDRATKGRQSRHPSAASISSAATTLPLEEITYTPTTHRISKAKKGKKVHACSFPGCPKIFTRAEHRKRHEANHNAHPAFRCHIEGCSKPFQRADLLARHLERQHEIPSEPTLDSKNGLSPGISQYQSFLQRNAADAVHPTPSPTMSLCSSTISHTNHSFLTSSNLTSLSDVSPSVDSWNAASSQILDIPDPKMTNKTAFLASPPASYPDSNPGNSCHRELHTSPDASLFNHTPLPPRHQSFSSPLGFLPQVKGRLIPLIPSDIYTPPTSNQSSPALPFSASVETSPTSNRDPTVAIDLVNTPPTASSHFGNNTPFMDMTELFGSMPASCSNLNSLDSILTPVPQSYTLENWLENDVSFDLSGLSSLAEWTWPQETF